MKLKELLYKVSIVKVIGTTDVEVLNIQFDSRKVKNGDLFIAIRGTITDGHKYIEETINSVLNQTFKDFEVLVIYDDENKSDINFIEKFCKKDSRVKLIINEKNLGAGECRNIGIDKSSSEFVAFLDADDVWQKEKLSKQINFMISNSHLVSHTSYSIIDENGEKQSSRIAKKLN